MAALASCASLAMGSGAATAEGAPRGRTASATSRAVKKSAAPRRGAKKPRRARPAPAVLALTKDGRPNVQAAAGIVVDLDTGAELYAKKADDVRAIASVGKLFVALVVRDRDLPLEAVTTITEDDRRRSRGGARSRLEVGRRYRNVDLLRAMLIASDNRACSALGRAVGLTPDQLILALNKKARALGLKRTIFTDTSGLRGNVSTAREVLVALRAALADPLLAEVMTTPHALVRSEDERPAQVDYFNTNLILRAGGYEVLGGKTGFNNPARYCLAIAARLRGKRVGMVFLGAEGELTRFADFKRVAQWVATR